MDAAQRRTETSLRIDPGFFKLLSQSDARLLGKPLAPEHVLIENAPRWLYDSAPFGLLKHNPNADIPGLHCRTAVQHLASSRMIVSPFS
jgi:hypothetical protein